MTGICDLFIRKSRGGEIEESDERNIALSNAAMDSGFKVVSFAIGYLFWL